MKKTYFKIAAIFLTLALSVNTAMAQDQSTIYLASLKAQTDPASTGSGQVKLTWLDITGKPMEVDLAKQMHFMAFGDATIFEKGYVYDGFGETAQLEGATLIAIDGMEAPLEIGGSGSQIYMTSVIYFHAEAEPDNGSYLAEWAFTDPQITRMTSTSIPPAPVDPMGNGEDIPYRTPCFKVLPKTENSTLYPPTDEGAALAALCVSVADVPDNLYAVFKKYLLSNPVATSGSLDAISGKTTTLNVSVDVEGDITQFKENYADFVFPSAPGTAFYEDAYGTWSWTVDNPKVISPTIMRAHVLVTYTAKSGITIGRHNATITIKMAGGEGASELNIPLSVNALDPARQAVALYNGKDSITSGTWEQMYAIVGQPQITDPILKLNLDCGNLTIAKNLTLNLNGNTVGDITVNSGEVTVLYSKFGGSASTLTVNGGKAILNGGTFGSLSIGASGTVEQNGATITGAATNAGSLTTKEGTINGGLTSSKTLVMNGGTFKGTTAVTISGGTAAINRGTIEGTTCGLLVSGGSTTTKKLAAIKGATYSAQQTGGTLTVECGKFDGPLNGTINFTSGFFKTNTYGISTTGLTEMNVSAGVEYNEGYRYFLGDSESAIANGAGVCRIGSVSYSRLEDAIAYANNNPNEEVIIFMTNNYTLPAGYYTLPAKATIIVPMSDTQEKMINKTAPRIVFNDQKTETPYVSIQPTEFRRLTFASGVNMDVFGQIELTCSQYASNEAYTAQPCGAYGHLVLEEGSSLTLQSGSEVRAWGFVTGKGEMDARRGSKVREMFQLGDWKGAMTSVAITGLVKESENPTLCSIVKSQGEVDDCDYSDKKIFPVTQYFIQNIESPVKYHPGAVLSTSAAVSEGLLGMSVSMAATDIAIVGVSGQHQAIFLMDQKADAENTWVRKWYDSENDIQVYDINSAAHIGSMVLDMGDINLLTFGTVPIRLNSAKFDLPLTSNFKIHLLSGTMDFQQNTSLLPGAEVEVDKEATVTVAMDDDEKAEYDAWVTGGKVGDAPVSYTGALYVYDADEWDKYAYRNEYNGSSFDKGTAYTKIVRYAPSWEGKGTTPGKPDVRNEQVKPADAAINVHGTFSTAKGFVYCSEHGANIFSSNEDAGTFVFNQNAEDAGERTVYNVKSVKTYEDLTFYPAKLKNGVADPAFANTSTAEAGDAYCYTDDKWNIFEVASDPCFMVDDYDTYYAKPQEYVALTNGMTPNADHTYSDKAGAGRLFILMDNCQWWEVENIDNLYHCIHPENDTYYYWDDDEEAWLEQRFMITWKNWNGDTIQTADGDGILRDSYKVKYGTMAEFLGTNPTRESNIDYTYDFTGWSPTPGRVTSDVTYTATFTEKPRKYTIIFCQEGGSEIERQFLTHNEMPVCENTPTRIGHTLEWTPAIAAVTGDATYTAKWHENPPTEYEVTFFDYDGTTELQKGNVDVGAMPAYTGATPSGKSATSEFTYVFDHWSPALETVSATSVKSYTAIYSEVPKTYTVIFLDEDESEIERHEYRYGETPVCSATPTKENTAQYTYSFAWTPQIQTVMGAATYKATFAGTINKYTLTLRSNNSAVCSFSGQGIYEYGTNVDIVANITNDYEFVRWEGDKNLVSWTEDTHGSVTIEGDITLTLFVQPKASEPLLNKTVGLDDTFDVPAGSNFNNFIIVSDGSDHSAQVLNIQNANLFGEAYYDLKWSGGMEQYKWYVIAVPWQVETSTGIYVDGVKQTLGETCEMTWYDGAKRAKNGTDGSAWTYLSDGDILQPGRAYSMYITRSATTIRFKKKLQASIANNKVSVAQYPSQTGSDADANWNGIANPTVYHAYLNAHSNTASHPDFAQKYIPIEDNYELIDMSAAPLVVGQPVYVQVPTAGSVVISQNQNVAFAPQRRRAAAQVTQPWYEVVVLDNDKVLDHLYIHVDEDKQSRYTIGQDLAKAGVSKKVAQMWIDRFDAKLCVNTMAPINEVAEYPLGIFVPKAGEYRIALNTSVDEANNVYLTCDGQAVWNLSYGAFDTYLEKGESHRYGIRVVAKAPQVVTDIDEAVVGNNEDAARKVLLNGTLYIIRAGEVYTIGGEKVQRIK